eukprot:464101-Amphidinium_carterae.1
MTMLVLKHPELVLWPEVARSTVSMWISSCQRQNLGTDHGPWPHVCWSCCSCCDLKYLSNFQTTNNHDSVGAVSMKVV